jgi:hypothetical protein
LKIKNWTNCIQDRKNWKLYVEKVKNIQRIEVVAPEEEEEEYSHPKSVFVMHVRQKCEKRN